MKKPVSPSKTVVVALVLAFALFVTSFAILGRSAVKDSASWRNQPNFPNLQMTRSHWGLSGESLLASSTTDLWMLNTPDTVGSYCGWKDGTLCSESHFPATMFAVNRTTGTFDGSYSLATCGDRFYLDSSLSFSTCGTLQNLNPFGTRHSLDSVTCGVLNGKTVNIVAQDFPFLWVSIGNPEIVQVNEKTGGCFTLNLSSYVADKSSSVDSYISGMTDSHHRLWLEVSIQPLKFLEIDETSHQVLKSFIPSGIVSSSWPSFVAQSYYGSPGFLILGNSIWLVGEMGSAQLCPLWGSESPCDQYYALVEIDMRSGRRIKTVGNYASHPFGTRPSLDGFGYVGITYGHNAIFVSAADSGVVAEVDPISGTILKVVHPGGNTYWSPGAALVDKEYLYVDMWGTQGTSPGVVLQYRLPNLSLVRSIHGSSPLK